MFATIFILLKLFIGMFAPIIGKIVDASIKASMR